MKKYMSLFLTGLLFISGCSALNHSQSEDPMIEIITGEVTDIAKAYANYFSQGNFEALNQAFNYDEVMKKAADNGQIQASLEMTYKLLGEVKEIGEPLAYEQEGYYIQSVPMVFENDSINLNVVFNEKDEIAGINIGAFDSGETLIELHGIEKELNFKARDGKELTGTLTLPNENGDYPVVILVHGSGASNRDEEITPQNKVFRDLAWLLADHGIATYRYDKRTYLYGDEFVNDYDFTVYDETVNDAIDAVNWIKKQDNIDENQVYVLGHSLGGMMIPAIAQAYNATGYIMMAAPVTRLDQLILEQMDYLVNLDGEVSQEENEQLVIIKEELAKLEDLDSLADDVLIQGGYKAYWESILNYNPINMAENISSPVLVLQGEEDYQVPMREFEMWKKAYGEKLNWTFVSYSGLSHLMQVGSLEEGPASYSVPSVVDSRVIEDIRDFIHDNNISH